MTDLEDMARRIRELSPPDQLRLAGDLLDAGKAELAHGVAHRVVLDLGAALAIRRLDAARKEQGR
jgi:hypothetical protein